jgi:preprotein translocase subunit SecG
MQKMDIIVLCILMFTFLDRRRGEETLNLNVARIPQLRSDLNFFNSSWKMDNLLKTCDNFHQNLNRFTIILYLFYSLYCLTLFVLWNPQVSSSSRNFELNMSFIPLTVPLFSGLGSRHTTEYK